MAAPALRRGFKVLGICFVAAFLLVLSFTITLSGFLLWHIFSTRPYHAFPLSFKLTDTSQSPPYLGSYVSLSRERGLRSVQHLTVSVQLELPESRINLDNSVFHVTAELYGRLNVPSAPKSAKTAVEDAGGTCLARGSAQATLRYRSPVYSAIRALVMSGPLLLGLAREYQTVRVDTLFYTGMAGEDGKLPLLNGVHVRLHPSQVQVAEAKVVLHVVRRSFLKAMVSEQRISTFLVLAIGLWYVMLAGFGMVFAIVSAARKMMGKVWNGFFGEDTGEDFGAIGEVSEQISEVSFNRAGWDGTTPTGSLVSGSSGSGEKSWIEREGVRKRSAGSAMKVS